MPYVVNGIGTWYYGKDHVHRRKDVCEFCNNVGELVSYDTTHYFVVFFIPLVPLGRKRVLHECPHCQKHRMLPLKKWEEAKAADITNIMEALDQDPENRDTTRGALQLAMYYQDEGLFNKLADALAQHRRDDAGIQAQLGHGYAFFVRYPEAEQAFRASLAVEDNVDVRRSLALVLLKQLRPDEARPLLQDVLNQRVRDEAGLIYLLIEAYQALGQHKDALAVIDQRDAAFPETLADKDCQKQRKTSEKYADTSRPIKPVFLTESRHAGYREGGFAARFAKIAGPVVLAALALLYLGSALWIGMSRKVFLVNGADVPYKVAVNGTEYLLQPQSATLARVAEGEVTVESRDPAALFEATTCRVESSFWGRPFASRTFVINPDRIAAVVWNEAEYAKNPRPGPGRPPRLYAGRAFYEFSGIDYEFEPFPATISVKGDRVVKKTRVSLQEGMNAETRVNLLDLLDREEDRAAYARAWVTLDPNNLVPLSLLVLKMKEPEALEFLRPGLAERPLRVEWHRFHQDITRKVRPDADLKSEYEKLVAEMKGHADAVYLLGRVLPTEEADGVFRKAAEANPPSAYAVHALGFDALARGRFAESVKWTEKARQLAPNNVLFQHRHESALLAAGQYDRLLAELNRRGQGSDLNPGVQADRIRVYVARGDRQTAEAAVNDLAGRFHQPDQAQVRDLVRRALTVVLHCARNDVSGYLKTAAEMPETSRFEVSLLQGKLHEARSAIDGKEEDRGISQRGLLFLAAHKAGDTKLAEEQWKQIVEVLLKRDHHSRRLGEMMAGRQPLNVELIRKLPLDPKEKRVLLAAVAFRLPEQANGLRELALALDFHRDTLSLCLRRCLE